MAFAITVQVNAHLAAGATNRVRTELQRALTGISATADVKVSPESAQRLAQLTRGVEGLTRQLSSLTGAAAGAAGGVDRSASAYGRLSAQAQAAAAAVGRAATTHRALVAGFNEGAQSAAQFGQQVGLAARRFAAYTAAVGSFYAVVNALREGVTEAIKFDLQMNKLAQVADEGARGVGALRGEILSLAKGLGVSSADLAEGAVAFTQAGLRASEAAKAVRVFAQALLSPNFGSAKQTTEGMIAVYQQFGRNVDRLGEQLGAMNAVAGAFAVEAGDLVTAVQKAGGAFSTAGGSLNELLALMTAVRATTRESADQIATGLRSIFTYVQRDETSEALKAFRINLRYTRQEAEALAKAGLGGGLEGQFVGPYRAVVRLAEGLRGLRSSDPRFSSIVEDLGGVRQISRVLPLIQQVGEAQRALNVARLGSASLEAAAATRQDAVATKLQKVRESFGELTKDLVANQGFKSFIDGLKQIGDGLAYVLKNLGPVIPSLAAFTVARAAVSAGPFLGGVAQAAFKPVQPARRFAEGGPVPLQLGTPGRDSVPALVMPGEYVLRSEAAQNIGQAQLNYMNQTGRVPGFAAGGPVGPDRTRGFVVRGIPGHGPVSARDLDDLGRAVDDEVGGPASLETYASLSRFRSRPHPRVYYPTRTLGRPPEAVLNRAWVSDGRIGGVDFVPRGRRGAVDATRDAAFADMVELFGAPNRYIGGALHELGRRSDLGAAIAGASTGRLWSLSPSGLPPLPAARVLERPGVLDRLRRMNRLDAARFVSGLVRRETPGSYTEHLNPLLRAFVRTGHETPGLAAADALDDAGAGAQSAVLRRLVTEGFRYGRFAAGGYVSAATPENVAKVLAGFRQKTGVDYSRLVAGVLPTNFGDRFDLFGEALDRDGYDPRRVVGTFLKGSRLVGLNTARIGDYGTLRRTLAHELGHALDFTGPGGTPLTSGGGLFAGVARDYVARLMRADAELGIRHDNRRANYLYSPREGFAEAHADHLGGVYTDPRLAAILRTVARGQSANPLVRGLGAVGRRLARFAGGGPVARPSDPLSVFGVLHPTFAKRFLDRTGIDPFRLHTGVQVTELGEHPYLPGTPNLGDYNFGSGLVRLASNHNSRAGVLYHELGHGLEQKSGVRALPHSSLSRAAYNIGSRFAAVDILPDFPDITDPRALAYLASGSEGLAQLVRNYVLPNQRYLDRSHPGHALLREFGAETLPRFRREGFLALGGHGDPDPGAAAAYRERFGFAAGGPVPAHLGTPGKDSVLAALEPGEFVIRTAAARRLGRERLDYMNRQGSLPGYADGGLVGYTDGGTVGRGGRPREDAGDTTARVHARFAAALEQFRVKFGEGSESVFERVFSRATRFKSTESVDRAFVNSLLGKKAFEGSDPDRFVATVLSRAKFYDRNIAARETDRPPSPDNPETVRSTRPGLRPNRQYREDRSPPAADAAALAAKAAERAAKAAAAVEDVVAAAGGTPARGNPQDALARFRQRQTASAALVPSPVPVAPGGGAPPPPRPPAPPTGGAPGDEDSPDRRRARRRAQALNTVTGLGFGLGRPVPGTPGPAPTAAEQLLFGYRGSALQAAANTPAGEPSLLDRQSTLPLLARAGSFPGVAAFVARTEAEQRARRNQASPAEQYAAAVAAARRGAAAQATPTPAGPTNFFANAFNGNLGRLDDLVPADARAGTAARDAAGLEQLRRDQQRRLGVSGYTYNALKPNGEEVSGRFGVGTEDQALRTLQNMGLFPTKLNQIRGGPASVRFGTLADVAADTDLARRGGNLPLLAPNVADAFRADTVAQQQARLAAAIDRQLQSTLRNTTAQDRLGVAQTLAERAYRENQRVLVDARGNALGLPALGAQIQQGAAGRGRLSRLLFGEVDEAGRTRFDRLRDRLGGPPSVDPAAGNFLTRPFRRAFRNVNATSLAYTGSFALPVLGEQFRASDGAVQTAAATGATGAVVRQNATAGGLQGAGIGAAVAAGFGAGPVGIAVAAVAGAGLFLVNSLRETARAINDAKLGAAVQRVGDRFTLLARSGRGLEGADVQSTLADIGTARAAATLRAVDETSSVFFRTDPAVVSQAVLRETRGALAGSAPGFVSVLSDEAVRRGRANPEGDPRALAQGLSDGLAGALAAQVAELRGVGVQRVVDELVDTLRNSQEAARAERALARLQESSDRVAATFDRLSLSAQNAALAAAPLRGGLDLAAGAFGGGGAVPLPGLAGAFAQLGSPSAREFNQGLRVIEGVLGGDAAPFTTRARAADQAVRVGPAVIRDLLSQPFAAGSPPETRVFESALRALNPAAAALPADQREEFFRRPENQAGREALDFLVGEITGSLRRNREGSNPFVELQGDPAEFLRRRYRESNYGQGILRGGGDFLGVLEQTGNDLVGGLAQARQQRTAAADARGRVGDLALLRDRALADARARSGDGSRFLTLDQLLAPARARQAALVAGSGVNPEDEGAIAARLRAREADAARLLEARNDPANRPRLGELAREFDAAVDETERLRRALAALANPTERLAALQERLAALNADREGRLGFAERFVTADPDERRRLARGQRLAAELNRNPAAFDGLTTADRRLAVEGLRLVGNTRFRDTNQTGLELLERVLGRTGVLNPGDEAERQRLTDQRAATAGQAASAQSLLADSLTRANDRFLTQLEAIQERFFQQLRANAASEQLTGATARLGGLQGEGQVLSREATQVGLLRRVGINSQDALDRARRLATSGDLQAFFEFTNEQDRTRDRLSRGFDTTAFAAAAARPENEASTAQLVDGFGSAFGSPRRRAAVTELLRASGGFEGIPQDQQARIAEEVGGTSTTSRGITNFFGQRFSELLQERGFTASGGGTGVRAVNAVTREQQLEVEALRRRAAIEVVGELAQPRIDQARRQTLGTLDARRAAEADRVFAGLPVDRAAVQALGRPEQTQLLQALSDAFRPGSGRTFEQHTERVQANRKAIEDMTKEVERLTALLRQADPGKQDAARAALGPAAVLGFAAGGGVPRGTDTVPAMLTPGEFVVNAASARANADLLRRVNAARGPVQYRQTGGPIVRGAQQNAPSGGAVANGYLWLNDKINKAVGWLGFAEGGVVPFTPYGLDRPRQVFVDAREREALNRENEERLFRQARARERAESGLVLSDPNGTTALGRYAAEAERRAGRLHAARREEAVVRQLRRIDRARDVQSLVLRQAFAGAAYFPGEDAQYGAAADRVGARNERDALRFRERFGDRFRRADAARADRARAERERREAERFLRRRDLSRASPSSGFVTPVGGGGGGLNFRRYAAGGLVTGTGAGDSVPSLLAPGEFVMTRRAVQAYGADALQRANSNPAGNGGGGGDAAARAAEQMAKLGTALGGFAAPAGALASALTTFGDTSRALGEALNNFPRTIELSHRIDAQVNLADGGLLASLKEEQREMLGGYVLKAVDEAITRRFPDAGAGYPAG